jgi:DNA-binding MarR family transcriptional regulator
MPYRPTSSEGHPDRAGRTVLAVSGALFSLAGFVLALGGYLSPEGSAFDVPAGLGLIVSGLLLSGRHRAGAWTYMLVLAGGIIWSLRNIAVGSRPAYRTIGPAARDRAAGTPDPLLHPTSERLTERTSAMMYDWQTSLRASDYYAVRILPPATIEETGWDILLALHSDRHCRLSLEKLASIVSVPDATIDRWLGALEERELITGARHPSTDELLAVLTEMGRGLLDRYFSATKDLQVGAHS